MPASYAGPPRRCLTDLAIPGIPRACSGREQSAFGCSVGHKPQAPARGPAAPALALGACVSPDIHSPGALLERLLGLVQPAGAQLTTAVGLPELSRLHVEARQPAIAVDPGVDADRVAPVARQPTALLGVPADHHFPRTVRAHP